MNILNKKVSFSLIFILINFAFFKLIIGCYSFTGGSIPPHLKTLYIANVDDMSGLGNPTYRELLMQKLFENFRNDNSFSIVDMGGDAKLYVKIINISDQPQTVGTNELVGGNRIDVRCEAEYIDDINKKTIWKKSFSSFDVYDVSNAQAGRDAAIQNAINQIASDILVAVVSGW